MINVPLMRKALEHITEHPEEHDQNVWAAKTDCGTSYCLAGHVAVMTGHQLVWDEDGEASSVQTGVTKDGARTTWHYDTISNVAADELGIDGHLEEALFWKAITIGELWEIANEATDGEIEIPEQFKIKESI